MIRLTRLIILAAIIFTECIPAVSATWDFQNYNCSQSNPLITNTPVNISFDIEFSAPPGGETFPSGGVLEMITYLTNPKWNYKLLHNGTEELNNSVLGPRVDLKSFVISRPANINESIHVTLEGNVPTVEERTHMMILIVSQCDAIGNNIDEIGEAASVINPNQVITTKPTISQRVVSVTSTIKQTQKVEHQSSILDQIIAIFKSLFGIES
jgi:hypothetical protein